MKKEHHINALEYNKSYDKYIQRKYKNKLIECSFLVRDMFIYENQHNVNTQPREKGRVGPNFLDAYIIMEEYSSSAYKIVDMDGFPFKDPINTMHQVDIMLGLFYPFISYFLPFFFLSSHLV